MYLTLCISFLLLLQNEEGIRHIPIRADVPQSGQQIPARPQQNFQNPPFTQQHFQQPPASQQYQHSSPQQSPDQRNQEEKGPTIRHIPIFVEGRDEPILPKDAAPTGMKRGGCQGKAESNSGKRGTQPEEKRQQQQQTTEPPPQPQPQQAPPHPPSKPDPLAQVADVSSCILLPLPRSTLKQTLELYLNNLYFNYQLEIETFLVLCSLWCGLPSLEYSFC